MTTMPTVPEDVRQLEVDHSAARERLAGVAAAAGMAADSPTLERIAVLSREFERFKDGFSRHMRKEDDAVLPVLETALGQWCALPAWMRREHDDLREGIRAVGEAVRALEREPSADAAPLLERVSRLESLFLIHTYREEQWLIPVARAVLVQEQWDEIARQLGEGKA